MGAIIFRKREHLFERQRVVRTLKIMALMGPIARVEPGSIRAQRSAWLPTVSLRSLIAALYRDDINKKMYQGHQPEFTTVLR